MHVNVPWEYGPAGHLNVAKLMWSKVLKVGDTAIDATCGNGHDSLNIAKLCLSPHSGVLHCIDIQSVAVENTKRKLSTELPSDLEQRVHYHICSHEDFPSSILRDSVSLICYNLGYLPGKKYGIISQTKSTVASLNVATTLIKPLGLLCVTAYPGHQGGAEENQAVSKFLSNLDPQIWRVNVHAPLNRPLSPILYLAYKIGKGSILI